MLKANKYYEYCANFDSHWAKTEYDYVAERTDDDLSDYANNLWSSEKAFYSAVESYFKDFERPFETNNLKIEKIFSCGYDAEIIFTLLKDMEEEDVKKEIRKTFDYTRKVEFPGWEFEVGLYRGNVYTCCVKETITESDYISEEEQEDYAKKAFKNSVMQIKNTTEYFNLYVIDDLWYYITVEECNKSEWPIFKTINDIEENNQGEKINEYSKDKIIEVMQKYQFWIGKTIFIPEEYYNKKENAEDFYNFDNLNGLLQGCTGIVYGFSINKRNEIYVVISDLERIYIKDPLR